MPVAHRFGQRTARTYPAAIRALAPAIHEPRDEHKRLQSADDDPPPMRRIGEHVIDVERPGQNEAVGPPICPRVPPCGPIHHVVIVFRNILLEQPVAEHLTKPRGEDPVVTQPRQNDLRQDEQGQPLQQHQRPRLPADVGRLFAPHAIQPERQNTRAVKERVIERARLHRHHQRAEQGRAVLHGFLPALRPSVRVDPRLGRAAALPRVDEPAKQDQCRHAQPTRPTRLALNRQSTAPKKIQRRFASNQREYGIIGQSLIAGRGLEGNASCRDSRHTGLENRVHIIAFQHGDVGRFGPRQHFSPVTQGNRRPAPRQRGRRLDRRVAATHDQHVPTGKRLRVVQAIRDLVERFTGHTEFTVIAAATDRDDHVPRPERFAAAMVQQNEIAASFEALDSHGFRFDPCRHSLTFQFAEQRLLHVGFQRKSTRRHHLGRIGVDRFALGEISDRRKRRTRLEHHEAQTEPLGLQRRGNAGHAATHDGYLRRASVGAPIIAQLPGDRLHGFRPRVGRKLQQRHARQISDDAHALDRRGAIRVHLRQLFDLSRRPLQMQPTSVAGKRIHAGAPQN